jgi:phenylpropionate dioxygenase-like ring-hydroxylating dioxygenase large terminal subunit
MIDIRTCGINPYHWYVAARSDEIQTQPVGITLWQKEIVLYRDAGGTVRSLENRCPHRQVKLSQGSVVGGQLECAYHGWRFNEEGQCSAIPYLSDKQKLPNCRLQTYPTCERDGFVWIFPGGKEASSSAVFREPITISEWEDLNYIATVSSLECRGHYSFLIENLMDMYHGHLHQDYQPWASAKLQKLEADKKRIDAYYEAQSYYKINKIWSISQLFFPALRRLHTEALTVSYCYPHWSATLGKDFKIYCLLCPIDETHTRAYLIHFTSLQAFKRLHKLPVWFRRWLKNRLFGSAQKILDGLVEQDILMIEQEQAAYEQNRQQQIYELNPTINRVQILIKQQLQKAKN